MTLFETSERVTLRDQVRALCAWFGDEYWRRSLGSPAQTVPLYPDETSDPSMGQAHLVFQVQQGSHRIIAPAPYATSSFSELYVSR